MFLSFLKKNWAVIFIISASLLPLINLVTPGLPITHDGLDHVARVASFYKNLGEGNLIPRWAGNLNWGYGHPILMFLYPLPSYIASIFHFLDFNFVDSLKLTFATSYIFSGIFMYLWLRKFLEEKSSIVGSVLYLFAPYRFIDIYVRGAIGEHLAFVFLPLILLTLFNLNYSKNKKGLRKYFYFLATAFSFTFLILSHNAISLLFIPFIIFYIFYLFYLTKSKSNLLINSLAISVGFLISFFFWFPAFIEGKYTLRDIVTNGAYLNRFVEIKDLFYGPWNYGGTGQFTVQLGIIQIVLIFASLALAFRLRKNDELKYLLLGCLLFLVISIFLMVGLSEPIWSRITTLQKLQFPWRFLSLIAFFTGTLGAIVISEIKSKYLNALVLLIILIAIFSTASYWHAKEYIKYNDSYFLRSYNSTTDTGESSPIWSTRSMDKFPNKNIELLEGNATIKDISRTSTRHEYIIDAKEKIRLKENTLYFPGWEIYDNQNLLNSIEFQDAKNRGVITFYLNPGLHNIVLEFEDTKIRKISTYISFLTLLIIFIPYIYFILKKLND